MLEIVNFLELLKKKSKINIKLYITIFLCITATTLFIGCYLVMLFTVSQQKLMFPLHNLLLSKSQVNSKIYFLTQLYTVETKETKEVGHDYNKDFIKVDNVISCYYNCPDYKSFPQLLPENINPILCTHINVAFATVVNYQIIIDDNCNETLAKIVDLKKINPQLKILLSVGGAGNEKGFSDMVVNHASRKVFIKSIKSTLKIYSLDGIDLDWEFPVLHNKKNVFANRERQHFTQLLMEIRKEYVREKHDFLLTAAVAAPEVIVDVAYDVDQLNLYVDYVNVMTYDFHSYTKFTPFTGFNSPLFARTNELAYLATLNINYTVNLYLDKGLNKNKLVIGIPIYGHTFTLVNENNNKVGSPAAGYGSLGHLGFIDYSEICLLNKNLSSPVTVKRDDEAKVPYLYRKKDWISYDDCKSVAAKALYAKQQGLRGVMVYSLNSDDYSGVCHEHHRFPMMQCINYLQEDGYS